MQKAEELFVGLVELKGNHFQFGIQQSEELKSSQLMEQMHFLKGLTTDSNSVRAKELLDMISPTILQELGGLSKGSGLPIDTIVKLYSGYDVVFPEMGCSTLIQNGYYVRNYDFSPELYDARLVFSQPTEGYASVGFSQQLIGRLDGMNEKGLVVGLHFVNNEHKKEGFLATTIVRMILEQCANLKEAIQLMTTIPHGYCYNYSITDQSGKSAWVEASPEQQVVNYANPLVCTNHFESEILAFGNKVNIQGSVQRKKYIEGICKENLSPMSAYRYFNAEKSPLFFTDYKGFFGTLHTVVYLPKELKVIIGIGGNSEPVIFFLKEYMTGNSKLPKVINGNIKSVK